MAASPRPPSGAIGRTALSAGVLGETAPAVAGRRRALVLGVKVKELGMELCEGVLLSGQFLKNHSHCLGDSVLGDELLA